MFVWMIALTLLLAPGAERLSDSGAPDNDDPFLWLERIDDEGALEWARDWNRKTVEELEAVPEFRDVYDRSLEILNSRERIAVPDLRGEKVYNFWQDAANVRGVWRRAELDRYLTSDPRWEVLLDLDELARSEGENWVYKGATCLWPEHRHCMIHLSRGGGDAVVLREFDTAAGTFVEGGFEVPEAKSRISWRDRDSLWVGTDFGEATLTDSGYPRTARLWRRGTGLDEAQTVFEAGMEDMSVAAMSMRNPDGRYDLVVRRPSFFESERFLILDGRRVRLDLPPGANLHDLFRDRLLVSLRSDWDVGVRTYPRGALLAIELNHLLEGGRDFDLLFEPEERVSLGQVATTRDRVVIATLENVRGRLYELAPSEGGWARTRVDLPDLGTVAITSAESDSDRYFVTYSDFLTPSALYFVEAGRAREVRRLPEFFDASGLESRQYEAVSRDGTRVPYFLVGPRGLAPDGTHPTLLYGYGGFEIPMRPGYSATVGAAWLERGGVYVVANIRGGGEFGARWHQAALKENRHRAFEDFVAVAEDLIRRGITSPRRLGIMGGSNGGLLVGAAFTLRPELFNAVVCQVPLLDMRRYHRLLAGASWTAEYGDPDDPEMWSYIRTYSPYHNVEPGREYPRVLFTSSTRDDRVHPGHARKMVARMSEQGHPVYYYENIEGGHGGAANSEQRAFINALIYAYLWKMLG
jgi:prolyl oligopeptidase